MRRGEEGGDGSEQEGGVIVLCDRQQRQEPPALGVPAPFDLTSGDPAASITLGTLVLGSCEVPSGFWFARMNATVELLGDSG